MLCCYVMLLFDSSPFRFSVARPQGRIGFLRLGGLPSMFANPSGWCCSIRGFPRGRGRLRRVRFAGVVRFCLRWVRVLRRGSFVRGGCSNPRRLCVLRLRFQIGVWGRLLMLQVGFPRRLCRVGFVLLFSFGGSP